MINIIDNIIYFKQFQYYLVVSFVSDVMKTYKLKRYICTEIQAILRHYLKLDLKATEAVDRI